MLRAHKTAAFTLLEVMVAIGILAAGLATLMHAQTLSARSVSRAKMLTMATALARARMVELEDELVKNGFPEFEVQEDTGDFSDDEQPRIKWATKVEKITLPGTVDLQNAASALGGAAGGAAAASTGAAPTAAAGATSPMDEMFGQASGAITSSFELIRDILEQAIRRVTVTVTWTEGVTEQSMSIQAYLTDPARIDAATGGGALPPAIPGETPPVPPPAPGAPR